MEDARILALLDSVEKEERVRNIDLPENIRLARRKLFENSEEEDNLQDEENEEDKVTNSDHDTASEHDDSEIYQQMNTESLVENESSMATDELYVQQPGFTDLEIPTQDKDTNIDQDTSTAVDKSNAYQHKNVQSLVGNESMVIDELDLQPTASTYLQIPTLQTTRGSTLDNSQTVQATCSKGPTALEGTEHGEPSTSTKIERRQIRFQASRIQDLARDVRGSRGNRKRKRQGRGGVIKARLVREHLFEESQSDHVLIQVEENKEDKATCRDQDTAKEVEEPYTSQQINHNEPATVRNTRRGQGGRGRGREEGGRGVQLQVRGYPCRARGVRGQGVRGGSGQGRGTGVVRGKAQIRSEYTLDGLHYLGKDQKTIWDNNTIVRVGRTPARNIVTRLPGPRGEARHVKTPLESFLLFFPDEEIDKIVQYTNKFIDTVKDKFTRERDAGPTNNLEIRALLGLLFLAGVLKSSHQNVHDLWSTDGTGVEIFRCVMNEKRFKFLLRAIRFDNIDNRLEMTRLDKLAKIRSAFDPFVERCKSNYSPSAYVTIDEMLDSFRGKCPFRQYIPKNLWLLIGY